MPIIASPSENEIALNPSDVEDRIREELRAAFLVSHYGPAAQRAEAIERLNQAVEKLYDFVVRGKVPAEFRERRATMTAGA
jgi:hypothetical protein